MRATVARAEAPSPLFSFDNSYARLPDRFYVRQDPVPVAAPKLLKLNHGVARLLGLDPEALEGETGAAIFAGNLLPEGAEPLAMAYAGHQFGHFSPRLGDGRALLLGEIVGPDGVRRDVHFKGSGPTPFSRAGDGRAAIGPVLREYIISEAMAALGIPTTRTLAAAATGEPVYRETIQPGAVLTRIATSHVRVGTFQYFAARGDEEAVRILADYVIDRHYPEARASENPALALLEEVVGRQARLVARWLEVGFIHGVMNTDNMSVAGESIDFGPCAFMDEYDAGTVFSSIDRGGRYAYGNQPAIAQWNLARFAETLLPLLHQDEKEAIALAERAVIAFAPKFEAAHHAGLRAKLGLSTAEDGDLDLAADLLGRMAAGSADFTLTFRALAEAAAGSDADDGVRAQFADPSAYDGWAEAWRARLARDPQAPEARRDAMRAVNPAFIPRNHRVEQALDAAAKGDMAPFERLLVVLSRPFDDQPENVEYALPPRPEERVTQTFCGT